MIKKSMERARETARFTPEEKRTQSILLGLMCVGLIYNSYSTLTCECAQNRVAGMFVQSTDMWLSLTMNKIGIYFPKEIPFFFVMRKQNTIALIYALINLALIAAAIIGVPHGRQLLRNFLVVTTIYLNLRFDVDSGEVTKIAKCSLDNAIMIIGVIAGMHFMEAKEHGNREKFARRSKNITLAQIAERRKTGRTEENLFVTPQETTKKHLENI